MPKIRNLYRHLKDYFRERSRVRRVKANAMTLICFQQMEASAYSYIEELEAKVKAQGHVIKVLRKEVDSANMAAIDAELDLRSEQSRSSRGFPVVDRRTGLRLGWD